MFARIYTGSDATCISETTCLTFHQRRPMGCYSSKLDVPPSATTTAKEVTLRRLPSPVAPQVVRAPSRSSQRRRAILGHDSPQVNDVHMRERPLPNSTPQRRRPVTVDEDLPPVPYPIKRRPKTTFASFSRNTSPVGVSECRCRWSALLPH